MALDRRNLILMGVALIAAVVAAWAVRSWMTSQSSETVVVTEAPKQTDRGVEVLVAASNLPAGLIVKAEHLRWQPWPGDDADELRELYVVKNAGTLNDYVGSVTRESIVAGEPITPTRMVKSGDRGFLAAVLTPDMRAISIPINATTGISGLIFPGDRVDLVVTHQIAVPDESPRRASETVLTNIRVLAIDQRVDSGNGQPSVGKNVTIEVTPKQVEEIAVARQLGSFSLALRSLASTDRQSTSDDLLPQPPQPGRTHTWDSEVSRLLGGGAGLEARQKVVVMRGTSTSAQNFQKVSQ